MKIEELKCKKIVIWGTGKEGCASARFLRDHVEECRIVFVDENEEATLPEDLASYPLSSQIEAEIMAADILIKSPGVSLYNPTVQKFVENGGVLTSLMNLWLAQNTGTTTIAITGTKGKSTTTTLLVHCLERLGKKAVALGNIGIPVSECNAKEYDVCVLEVSSYQAATFSQRCAIGVLTSLFPEHLDWHKTVEAYYRDKCRLLSHCDIKLVEKAAAVLSPCAEGTLFNDASGFHIKEDVVYLRDHPLGKLDNAFLLRPHNHGNVCAVLAVIDALGLGPREAVEAMKDYQGLPHRQQLVANKDDIDYIDDSISTTPQSAMAALKVFYGRPLTLIAGGQDRGVDYSGLCDYIMKHGIQVVCVGESGQRIYDLLNAYSYAGAAKAHTMEEAVRTARSRTLKGGVILLSPGAPSYDQYKNYIERAEHFVNAIETCSTPQ